jgi:hypothetical protein
MNFQLVKNLFLTITLSGLFAMESNSQPPVKNYEKEWKKVEEFNKKNLPKSALAEVKKIYTLAKKDASAGSASDAQVIKSLVYMTGLQAETRENNEILSIKEIEKEIPAAKEPASSILKSLLAEQYQEYFENHRWQLYDRTKTTGFKKEDIATWDAADFHKKITELYLQSISKEKLLQQTKLEPFDAIIIHGNVRHLRPTLYDLLAHRAIDYFENDERDIQKPAYAFEIDQAAAFDPAADFIHRKFPSKDSSSLQHKALLIYQQLIAFHLNDAKPDALLDADIQRISFVKDNSTHPDKDNLYFRAINHIANQYDNSPAATQAWYLLAQYYNEKAESYKPFGDTSYRFARVKAKEICEEVLQQKDSSEGKINCYNLLNTLNSKSLQFSIEKVNVPNLPFRALVNYRNLDAVYLRLIKADENLKKELADQYGDKYWSSILAAKAERNWQQALPATNDLQDHSVEIKVDALPAGEYVLVAGSDKDFKNEKTILGARLFYVSTISYVNNNNDYFVLNRDNGQPLAKAAIQVWEQKYDYQQSKNVKVKGKIYQADANGFFQLDKRTEADNKRYSNVSYYFDITHNGERLFMDDAQYDRYYSRGEYKTITSVFLFADRSIYRPGQTVYFKGIVVERNTAEKKNTIKQGYETTVVLRDANYKDIDTINVKTNEFGSFNGKFQLPASGLNGQFSIYTKKDGGTVGFKVEEYKRPKFFVDYEPIKGTYKVNDTIKVTGVAKAYAGNNIDGAIVKYRVVREPRFLYPWLFRRWWQPPVQQMEIAHGEIKTGKDGKFIVAFTAIPDLALDKKFEPVFDYTVYADVTDINGETRSGEKSVSVSYKSLLLVSNIPSSLPADSLKSLQIRTENMNGEFEPANITVTITKLKEEKRLIRDRFWERPDQFVMSKAEYIKAFPYDEYDNESDFKSWEKGAEVFSKTDSVKENGKWKIENGQWAAGFYMLEISTTDKNGEAVKDVQYMELFDERSNQLNQPQYLWSQAAQSIEPGETTAVQLGTSADNVFIVHQLTKETGIGQQTTDKYSFTQLNNQKKSFPFSATEADRGGYGVGWLFVKHNRFYQYNQTIHVPWTNKDLSIEYASFRDKTLPGSEEKWKVKISGYKKEQVAAEMLAGMYDASLDQFYSHSWTEPSVWPVYYNDSRWNGSQNFLKIDAREKYPIGLESKDVQKYYDDLLIGSLANGIITSTVPFLKTRGKLAREIQGYAAAPVTEESADRLETLGSTGLYFTFSTSKEGEMFVQGEPVKKVPAQSSEVKIRKNFNETAFFFPELRTDSSGAIEFSFTLPEALTKWKFQALAHTKEAAFGYSTKEIITQKELMVQPNAPRFLREGDKMEFSTKIVNLTDKELTGQAELQLFDATSNQSVDGWFRNAFPNQYFTVAAGQSEVVKFPIDVPYLFDKALVWRIVARAGNISDGEENTLPVLTNRMLVTETMPLPMRGSGTKNFSFDKLLNSGNSESLQHHSLTLEYTSNPAWHAVQALPYLMEYPYDCAEQTWNRYYANTLAAMVANSSPKIKEVFKKWESEIPLAGGGGALISNLQKNQELKAVLLEETPWVLQAKNENEQKKNIALLFDIIKMSEQLSSSHDKLKQMQSSNGGFVWFSGGPDDRYMTQYIVTGIGHLKKLKAYAKGQDDKLNAILKTAIPYLDRKIKEDYDNLIRYKTDLKKYRPDYTTIQYLYMRSFFPEYVIDKKSMTAFTYFRRRAQQTWTTQSKYMQGMTALALYRTSDLKTPAAILRSLKETAINNEELGMYWKEQSSGGWFWYQAPIETQALLIEVFQEAGKDQVTVDDLRTWLLKNKQTNNWKTTKATAEACYALLLQGTEWLTNDPLVEVKLGNLTVTSTDNKQEAGTGYFRKVVEGKNVMPQMGTIAVTVTAPVNQPTNKPVNPVSWGGIYWQYFEDLDKITTASTPLKLDKKLFIETNTDRGPVLTPVNDGDVLKVGDKIKVRVELRVDRDMEYVHMKDMRASALEPVNVLSSYKWQGGLGYYESTKDASTNFFFSYLRKGTYVFEYPLFVTHAGNFSNGVTTIQCMYAPEFTSHSEGIRINVE